MKLSSLFGGFALAMGLAVLRGHASGVEYPAGGNFIPEEGTVEMWVTPTARELYPPDDGKYHSVFSLFSTKIPGVWNLGSVWYRHGTQLGIKTSMDSQLVPKGLTAILPGKQLPDWQAGRMQHFAFVWKGRDMQMFADGKPAGSKTQAIGLEGSMAGQKLLFGSDGSKDCPLILHAVRISSVAKTPEELAAAKPEVETVTLLLDRFDDPSVVESRKSTPEMIFSLGEQNFGVINGPVSFVTQPAPGIALSPR